ncbi:MAG: flagellar filament capping protein FliD, partial [Lachnospiraceae bacterium]|nr:flagellar filament capping protein FliD [Lachnospiraceae bacterium]
KTIKVNGKEFTVSSDTKVSDFVNLVKDAGLNASFDEKNGRFFISAKNSGAGSDFNFEQSGGDATDVLGKMGLVDTGVDGNGNRADTSAVKIAGADARIKLNGASFTSSSNTFSINGLTITAKEKTDGEININTETDYDAIYDKVKSFIKDYTSLINEMTELYNAPSNKGYDPLTDEEKDALTDSEVKKWEEKVNESLLRRDGNLGSISSMFREAMLQSFDYNGKSYSLSSFGINTGNYFTTSENERYGLHIDGDPDDSETSGNQDKLKAAIAADPGAVTSFFTNLTKNLYSKINQFTKSSETRSFGNFYDDKKMKEDLKTYEKKVSDWDDYVKSVEDRYYKQFSKMESAMTKLNSQQSYISSMFGA